MTISVSKDVLLQKYVEEKKPMHMVANEIGISVGSAFNYIHRYGIPVRGKHQYSRSEKQMEHIRQLGLSGRGKVLTEETRDKMSKAKKGKYIRPSKFGGHRKERTDGYISVYAPTHPGHTSEGYVMEHRLIMEEHIGRFLADNEVVHHINRNRKDNRIENLKLMTASEHMSFHATERHNNRKGK